MELITRGTPRRSTEMAGLAKTFTIDTEVAPADLNDLLQFIYHHYLLTHPTFFKNIKRATFDHERMLYFTNIGPDGKWRIDAEIRGRKPLLVKMTPSSKIVPQSAIDQLKEDLVIWVQLFEDKIRTTTLYFAWIKGEKIIPETMPSRHKRTTVNLFTVNIILFYLIFIGVSILLFSLLGFYAPIAIIAAQFLTVLFSDKIIMQFGKLKIDSKNKEVYLLQYHLPIKEYQEFRKKYGEDMILRMKQEIYEKTLAIGKEPSCAVGEKIFAKYSMKCIPERMMTKKVDVYGIVKKVADKFHLPTPKIVISNSMVPNAAATGPSPSHGAVLITTGLLAQLEDDEIYSVIGHEFGHLKGRDPLILFGLASAEYLLRLYVFLPFFLYAPLLYLMITMGVIYFIAKFFEARADLQSAIVIGQPQILAESLRKIGYRHLQFEKAPAYKLQSWLNWDPHPPIYFRVSRLEKLKTPVKVEHPLVQSVKDVINGFRAAL